MTLSTDIYITTPMPAQAVFDHALEILAENVSLVTFEEGTSTFRKLPFVMTTPGQGLPAWLSVTWNPEGPIRCYCHDEDEADIEEDHLVGHHVPDHAIEVNFDTTYGYQGPNGGGCTDLHHWLVAEVGAWLEEVRGADWYWRDEFTGDVYHRFDGLEQERMKRGCPV